MKTYIKYLVSDLAEAMSLVRTNAENLQSISI